MFQSLSRLASHVSIYFSDETPPNESNSLIFEEYADQHASTISDGDRDSLLRVLLDEYRHLPQHLPSGMVVVPSMETLLEWHGVLFVREGIFRGGVFKFVMHVPVDYPKSPPSIYFFNKVCHPLVDEETGKLDISPAFPNWRPGRDYLVLALSFVKKIFFKKELNVFSKTLQSTELTARCEDCVSESQRMLYTSNPNSPIPFSRWINENGEPNPAFLQILEKVKFGEPIDQFLAKDPPNN